MSDQGREPQQPAPWSKRLPEQLRRAGSVTFPASVYDRMQQEIHDLRGTFGLCAHAIELFRAGRGGRTPEQLVDDIEAKLEEQRKRDYRFPPVRSNPPE